MIGYLKGTILQVSEVSLILEVGGVGYEVLTGGPAESDPGPVGAKLELWIHTHVREDQITLFGFRDILAKKIFIILTGITGIGPKLALAATTMLPPAELVDAITFGNTNTLRGIPGVGKKMADRMILELKDKLAPIIKHAEWREAAADGNASLVVWNELNDALSGLGFADVQIRNVIKLLRTELKGKQPEINEQLKLALQRIKNC